MNLESFELARSGGPCFYRCRAFAGVAGVRHGFSTRNVGEAASFIADVGLDPERLMHLSQTHSDVFHIIEDSMPFAERPLAGDALISTGAPVAVRAADCFPVLIVDPGRRCVAAVHSGWRGTISRILAKTIGGMTDAFGSRPGDLLIALGPAIRACCFEVGPEVADAFCREFPGIRLGRPHPDRPQKTLLDLRAALGVQLDGAGVSRANVFDLDVCTACRTDIFYSYRRERDQAGSMIAAIGLVVG